MCNRGAWDRVGWANIPRARFPSKIPILFMWGKNKNVQFHGPEFIESIEKTPGSRWKSYDGAGHWLQESRHKGDIVQEMKRFMEK